VRGMTVCYSGTAVVDDVSVELGAGECVAIVGESGSGKTTLARSIVGLAPVAGGEVSFEGQVLPRGVERYPADARRRIQYVFQSASDALNPRRSIGGSIGVAIRQFHGERGAAAHRRAEALLEQASLSPRVLELYPSELSGGERQRVAIARALAGEPDILLCDEITSALDVSVQAAIVALLQQLQTDRNLALMFITHDIGLVRTIADRVVVMKDGRIVENGKTSDVIDRPTHEYSRSLVDNTPRLPAVALAG
jgi:peptide/nickel transport system ATP-binding protein